MALLAAYNVSCCIHSFSSLLASSLMLRSNFVKTFNIFIIFYFCCSLLSRLFTFVDIRNWIRYIEQHDSDNVHKILVGNKADMDESKRVCYIPFNVAYFACMHGV